jgi:hypothetical protein
VLWCSITLSAEIARASAHNTKARRLKVTKKHFVASRFRVLEFNNPQRRECPRPVCPRVSAQHKGTRAGSHQEKLRGFVLSCLGVQSPSARGISAPRLPAHQPTTQRHEGWKSRRKTSCLRVFVPWCSNHLSMGNRLRRASPLAHQQTHQRRGEGNERVGLQHPAQPNHIGDEAAQVGA